MGRIKSTAIKTLARDIIEEHGDKFTTNFEKNKKIIEKVREIESKKIRNVVTGYITKEMERQKNAKIM
jgi:small subunit ribosomal protein S17e